MSDIDLEEDLLALAGAGGSDEEEEIVPKRNKKSSKKSTSEDEKLSEKNPYPLEGKYIDEEDKERIESMDEIEREQILYSRTQEMIDYNERVYLAQRAAKEKRNNLQQERSTRSSTATSSRGTAKSRKLSELKKQRDRKARRDTGDAYSEEEEEEEEEDDDYVVPEADEYGYEEPEEDDDDYDPEKVEWASSRRTDEPVREVNLADLNKIRLGRLQAAKFLYYPEFKDVIKDCFARFNVGVNKMTGRPTYRMVKVLSIERGRKPYKLERSNVDLYAVCAVKEGDIKKVSMCFFSDSPLTIEEFEKYKSDNVLPSVKKIEKKYSELKDMATRILSNDEIKKIALVKQVLNRDYTGANAVIRRVELTGRLEIAKQHNDVAEIARLESALSKYQSARQRQSEKLSKHDKLNALDRVNERNRKRNIDAIRKAEIIASEKRRKDMIATAEGASTSNPFSRLKTNVRLYYQSVQKEAAEKHKQDQEDEESKKIDEKTRHKLFDMANYRQVGGIDKMIYQNVNATFDFSDLDKTMAV